MPQELLEMTVHELARKMQAVEPFILLDVREAWELNYARLADERLVHLPMSAIGRSYREAFSTELRNTQIPIVVMCHHGVRSANVAIWMCQNGWHDVFSLQGGIAAYAAEIDPSVGEY